MHFETENKYILSIVTVVYNDFKNIEKTLKSVNKIKFSKIQYIVIDGGSNDGTFDIINKYRPIIDILISEKDNGIYDAMNKGLKHALGDTIIFMNGGDVFYDKFDPILSITQHDYKNSALIGFSLQTYDGDVYLRPSKDKIDLLLKNPAHQAIFVPRKKYSVIDYDLRYKIAADYYWIKECIKDKNFIILDEIVSVFSLGGKSTSDKFSEILLMYNEMGSKFSLISCISKFLLFNLLGRKYSFRFLYNSKYKRL
jgi:glycosyltransferase involved in cell wall biosynthesis